MTFISERAASQFYDQPYIVLSFTASFFSICLHLQILSRTARNEVCTELDWIFLLSRNLSENSIWISPYVTSKCNCCFTAPFVILLQLCNMFSVIKDNKPCFIFTSQAWQEITKLLSVHLHVLFMHCLLIRKMQEFLTSVWWNKVKLFA